MASALLRSVGLGLLLAAPSQSTLVIFQWTASRILLGADSLAATVNGSEIRGSIQCKIHQRGRVFFTIIGINDDKAVKVDLVAIATKAADVDGPIEAKVAAFERLACDPIQRLWHFVVTNQRFMAGVAQRNGPAKITLVVVSTQDHAVALKEYTCAPDGSVSESPAEIRGFGPRRKQDTDYVAVGVYAEAKRQMQSDPALKRLHGVPFFVGFYQAQIAHEQYRLRQQDEMPRVGGEVCGSFSRLSTRQARHGLMVTRVHAPTFRSHKDIISEAIRTTGLVATPMDCWDSCGFLRTQCNERISKQLILKSQWKPEQALDANYFRVHLSEISRSTIWLLRPSQIFSQEAKVPSP